MSNNSTPKPSVTVSLRLPVETHTQLVETCDGLGITASAAVRELISQFIQSNRENTHE